MHVIPQSWSHLHILIGVFPSFGLLIVLGFYIAGLRTKNDGVRRTCLALLGLLALLSIPLYFSGIGSMAALSGNAKFSGGLMNTHYGWGMATLALLVIIGVVAVVELARSQGAGRTFKDPLQLVLLGFAIVTLGVSVVTDDFGWNLNHRELQTTIVIPEVSTSPDWVFAHLILNHVPTAGFAFALFFYVVALVLNNDVMKRGSLILFVICSIIGVPTYVAGTAAMWALTQPVIPEISKAVINSHRDMALWALFGMAFTGAASWLELWRSRYFGSFSKLSLRLVLLFAVVTLGIMTETGHRGGLINHPDIRTAADVLPTNPDAGISTSLETAMKEMIWFVPWQTVHFFGYCLIFAAAFAVVLRVLGFWKSLTFAAMHRLLLLGFVGVLMNVFSGMLMMLADSYRYVVGDIAFAPKVALIPIGAIAVLYFSASDRLWNVKAGEDAPATAKWVAVVVLLAWAGVIVCGRLLPYL
jgi:uncharacterized membrane protein/uncharacterized membrane protein (GlpM family)